MSPALGVARNRSSSSTSISFAYSGKQSYMELLVSTGLLFITQTKTDTGGRRNNWRKILFPSTVTEFV